MSQTAASISIISTSDYQDSVERNLLSEDSTFASNSSNVNLIDDPFQVTCSKCQNSENVHLSRIIPCRQDLRTFLQNTFEGKLILISYEKHGTLSDAMMNTLAKLLIDREVDIIFKENNVSLKNPLRKLTLPAQILSDLAKEVFEIFKQRQGTFFTPGSTSNNVKIGPTGKLISRFNYVRKLLIEAGALVITVKEKSSVTTPDMDENALTLLRRNLDFWTNADDAWVELKSAWETTYFGRQDLSKENNRGHFWMFEEFPCLADIRGSELVKSDFKLKYPNFGENIDENWLLLCRSLERFILSRKLDFESEKLSNDLFDLSENQKDCTIFMLLPSVIKAAASNVPKTVKKEPRKRRRLESDEEIQKKIDDRETFIVNVETVEVLKAVIERKRLCQLQNNHVCPYVGIVGSLSAPEAFFCVIGNILYKTESIAEALSLALKIFLGCNFSYPKPSYNSWLLLQKAWFRLSNRVDKSSVYLHKALSFIEADLGITID